MAGEIFWKCSNLEGNSKLYVGLFSCNKSSLITWHVPYSFESMQRASSIVMLHLFWALAFGGGWPVPFSTIIWGAPCQRGVTHQQTDFELVPDSASRGVKKAHGSWCQAKSCHMASAQSPVIACFHTCQLYVNSVLPSQMGVMLGQWQRAAATLPPAPANHWTAFTVTLPYYPHVPLFKYSLNT